MLKKVVSGILYIIYLLLIIVVVFELILRIWSPIPQRIIGNKLNLPTNQKIVLANKVFTKIQKNGIHTKNSLGFRGEEFSKAENKIKILTIGGSTTECYYVDDRNTWSNILALNLSKKYPIWLNNAGLNGHSTNGHILLAQTFFPQIKPNYALFLIGINDLAVGKTGNVFDQKMRDKTFMEASINFLEEYSRLANMIHSFYRSYKAAKLGLADNFEWDFKNFKGTYYKDNDSPKEFEKIKLRQINYAANIKTLIEICKKNKTNAVFITQPLVFGKIKTIDPTTGLDLGAFPINGINGEIYWKELEFYNETLRKICSEQNIKLIDLAAKLPKNTAYFVDDMHFSDLGCKKVAEIISQDMEIILAQK